MGEEVWVGVEVGFGVEMGGKGCPLTAYYCSENEEDPKEKEIKRNWVFIAESFWENETREVGTAAEVPFLRKGTSKKASHFEIPWDRIVSFRACLIFWIFLVP
jgi:hypothetical protein